MKKMKLHTPDLTEGNIDRIAALFPNCVTEAMDEAGQLKRAIDFDLLRQELAGDVVEGPQERYRLDWPGKRAALALANAPIDLTLRPCPEESVDFENTQNLYIEGDNLDALKLLQETYLGKVKMIYIDPPYNTGNDFIYDDDFSMSRDDYASSSGAVDEEGNVMFDEEKWKQNSTSNGRFHSEWLSMMYPRLKLARNLLGEDGAIFVSCDEGEQSRVRQIMDEIFGAANFVADLVWAGGRKNDSRLISVSHEYIVCYAQNKDNLRNKDVKWRQRKKGLDEIYSQHDKLKREHKNDFPAITRELKKWFKNLPESHPSKSHSHYSHVDSRGVYFPDNISWPGGGGPTYTVLHPVTGKAVKVPSRGWMTSDPKKMQNWIDEDRVHFGIDENSVPCIKSYLKNREMQAPYSVFYQDGRAASKRLRTLMSGDIFDFPKDEEVIGGLAEMMTSQGDIIIDFFSGSATTAHAVMQLNAEDGGKRRHIMVQLPEPCDEKSEAYKAGYQTIAEIGKERIRRAGQKILSEWHAKQAAAAENLKLETENSGASAPDVGFRVLKIDSSNFRDVQRTPDELDQAELSLHTEHIKPDRRAQDLLFQVLVDWGVDLSLPIREEKITAESSNSKGKKESKEYTVYWVDENVLAACFDAAVPESLIHSIAARKPLRAVFRDESYDDDSNRINVEQIFKLLSPATEVKSL